MARGGNKTIGKFKTRFGGKTGHTRSNPGLQVRKDKKTGRSNAKQRQRDARQRVFGIAEAPPPEGTSMAQQAVDRYIHHRLAQQVGESFAKRVTVATVGTVGTVGTVTKEEASGPGEE